MKPGLILGVLFSIQFTTVSIGAVILEWEIPENERLEIVRTATVDYLINNVLTKKYGERNIINLSCYKKENNQSSVKGDFTVYQRNNDNGVFKILDTHYSDFIINSDGRFLVGDNYIMPNLRHIPTFTKKSVEPGDIWEAKGEILFNNLSTYNMIEFPVNYKLLEIKTVNGVEAAVINYSFSINKILQNDSNNDIPIKISGKNNGRLFWDIKNKKPYLMDDQYTIAFIRVADYNKLIMAEFRMGIETRYKMYTKTTPDEKNKVIREIKKLLPDESGISVDEDKRGIVLRLGEILFDFDSYHLKGSTVSNLDNVTGLIMKNYKDREIVVEGHTDNVGKSDYNQKLSENRANSVAMYLREKGLGEKLSYRGYGKEKPLFDNTTQEGRRKNRRVEIIINMQ